MRHGPAPVFIHIAQSTVASPPSSPSCRALRSRHDRSPSPRATAVHPRATHGSSAASAHPSRSPMPPTSRGGVLRAGATARPRTRPPSRPMMGPTSKARAGTGAGAGTSEARAQDGSHSPLGRPSPSHHSRAGPQGASGPASGPGSALWWSPKNPHSRKTARSYTPLSSLCCPPGGRVARRPARGPRDRPVSPLPLRPPPASPPGNAPHAADAAAALEREEEWGCRRRARPSVDARRGHARMQHGCSTPHARLSTARR